MASHPFDRSRAPLFEQAIEIVNALSVKHGDNNYEAADDMDSLSKFMTKRPVSPI